MSCSVHGHRGCAVRTRYCPPLPEDMPELNIDWQVVLCVLAVGLMLAVIIYGYA